MVTRPVTIESSLPRKRMRCWRCCLPIEPYPQQAPKLRPELPRIQRCLVPADCSRESAESWSFVPPAQSLKGRAPTLCHIWCDLGVRSDLRANDLGSRQRSRTLRMRSFFSGCLHCVRYRTLSARNSANDASVIPSVRKPRQTPVWGLRDKDLGPSEVVAPRLISKPFWRITKSGWNFAP
jgi:hypothetical protein